MTSVAIGLAGLGAKAEDGSPVDPKSFNKWLEHNGGYYCAAGDCNNLNLTAPERYNRVMTLIGEAQKPSFDTIVANIKSGAVVHVAHVRNNSHFVLLVWPSSSNAESFIVHDPYFPDTEYAYANITDIIAFHVDKYPMYKQCDPRWGAVTMGGNGKTICEVGCLMTSITMGLAGTGIPIDNKTAIPPLTDHFLQSHDGFLPDSSALKESVIPQIAPARVQWPADGMHGTNDLTFDQVAAYLDRPVPRIVIANVMHGQHFVLITGYRNDGDTFVVNDPGFPNPTYSYSRDVVGYRIFDME